MRWLLPPQKVDTDILQYLLDARGIAEQSVFLNPQFEQIHHPGSLFDAKAAAKTILKAVKDGKKIFVHGDYDVDGVCATSILWDFLYRKLGADALPYIPSRFDEGYGLSQPSLDAILEQKGQLVITVDCGIKNAAEVAEYAKKGLEFVITDHHSWEQAADAAKPGKGKKKKAKGSAQIDDLCPVVHPAHPQGEYPFPSICGAAVAWKLVWLMAEMSKLKFDPQEYLDMVALATICDVMPLIDENRAIVALGLEGLRHTKRPGLLALYQVAGVAAGGIQSYHPGYILGPRLNAAGRLESAMDALRLLTTSDLTQAEQLAQKLHALNAERQRQTMELTAQAEQQIAKLPPDQKLFLVSGEGWPEGLVGLVAGKLTEKYNRPVLVASQQGDQIKGSARSTTALHIADAFKQLDHLLLRHGGHAQAAGFTLLAERLEEFAQELGQLADKSIGDGDLSRQLPIDIWTNPKNITVQLAQQLTQLEPFGFGNPTPIFAFTGVELTDLKRIGKENQHLKLGLDGLEAIAFGAKPSWFGLDIGTTVDIAGTIMLDEWNGRQRVKLSIKDVVESKS